MRDFKIEYLPTRIGLNTIKVNGYLLHSKYNPIKEAEQIIKNEFKLNYIHILFGYGMGYIADQLKKEKIDENKLIIIEPLKSELKIENEGIYDGDDIQKGVKDKIKSILKNNSRKINVICSPNYNKIFPTEYKQLLQVVKDVQRDSQVEENTIRRFSEYWEENYTKNLLTALVDSPLTSLKNVYDCPIVVASGGPSLVKQLDKLKEIRNNIILIASGSTINTLLSYSIEPDYIVTIDGDEENYHHFKDLKLENVDLLYSMSSQYEIQREFRGKRFPYLTFNDGKLKALLEESLDVQLPLIAGGGSVATFALSIAKYMTSGPIAIIGQDLAYTNYETHAKSNKYYKKIDDEYFTKIGAFETEGYFGDKVMTDYAFQSMQWMFEHIQELIPHVAPLYNCTEGGVKLAGFDQISFEKFIKQYVNSSVFVQKKVIENNINKKEKCGILEEFLSSENKKLTKMEKKCLEAVILVKSTKDKFEFKQTILSKMEKIDKDLKDDFDVIRMHRIFEPLVMDVMRNYEVKESETPKESFQRVYNQNLELYSRLMEAINKAKKYNLDTLEYIKEEV